MDFSSATATQHPGSELLPIPAKTFQTISKPYYADVKFT
jgi:hypothetical protein